MNARAITGLMVEFGSTKWAVPSLNRTLLKKHADKFKFFHNASNQSADVNPLEVFDMQCEMVFDALKLNYPTLTQAEFDDAADMSNMQVAFPACLGNLIDAAEAQQKNAKAVSHSGSLTGMQTPLVSLPGQAGVLSAAGA